MKFILGVFLILLMVLVVMFAVTVVAEEQARAPDDRIAAEQTNGEMFLITLAIPRPMECATLQNGASTVPADIAKDEKLHNMSKMLRPRDARCQEVADILMCPSLDLADYTEGTAISNRRNQLSLTGERERGTGVI